MSQLTFDDLPDPPAAPGAKTGGEPALLVLGRGARSVERDLFARLVAHRDRLRTDPGLAARPLRIVVPSRSLRLHLAARIAAELGPVAGVLVQTVHALALEALADRAGGGFGSGLFDVLVRRAARADGEMQRAFEGLENGYAGVVESVRDLFDAGFEAELAEAALEALGDSDGTRTRRARSLVRIAANVATRLDEAGARDPGSLLRDAARAIETDAARCLPTHEAWIHGFADVTGRVGDVLAALARHVPTRAWVDHPPDPAAEGTDTDETRGNAFTERLVERLQGLLGQPASAAPAPATGRDWFRAPGEESEVREVAARVRGLLDAGAPPESIGIVARDLRPYRTALRTQLHRLGVPFSALRARAPFDGAGRRVLALVELLRKGADCTTDRWLDALQRFPVEDEEKKTRVPSFDLRLGLRAIGAARLSDVASIEPARLLRDDDTFPLPARHGLRERSEDGQRGTHATQRRLHGALLRGIVTAARALTARFERWPEEASFASHLRALERLRARGLGWRAGDEAERRVRLALEAAADDWPEDATLSFGELVEWLARELERVAAPPLGGRGGGVAVLDAMEARGRTFEHLFVVGLRRDTFPRAVHEDPLLPDDVRARLAPVLPDVPIKSRGHDEERFLFAQLASAGAAVTMSWLVSDDEGRAAIVSPLVERILGARGADEVPQVAPLFPQQPEELTAALRPAHEHAVLAGLHGSPSAVRASLRAALAEADATAPPARVEAAANARTAVLRELDRREPVLGPWLGLLGDVERTGARPDPLREALYVTRLEAMAKCPWQAFLRHVLRLEPPPDPLADLPAVDARLIGNTVHEVLEAIVERAAKARSVELPHELHVALETGGFALEWPAQDELEALLARVAAARVEDQFHADLPGLVRVLVDRVRPCVANAATLEGSTRVLGVEVHGAARVTLETADGPREAELRFRADRVDRMDDTVVLTDYKTGKRSLVDNENKLGEQLTLHVATGETLQAGAYVEAAAGSAAAVGRYAFLAPDLEAFARRVDIDGDAEDLRAAFRHAVRTTLSAWRSGAFFPRVSQPNRNQRPIWCDFCDFSDACSVGDSGARLRLMRWAEAEGDAQGPDAAVRALWFLGHEEDGT